MGSYPTKYLYMATKKKASKPKPPKKRASKYDEKLIINGSFEELVKELITPANTPAKKK